MKGRKDDADKLRMDLIPTEATYALARVLTTGAKKYDDNNWRGGIKFSRLVGALKRHLTAWESGEIFDKESGFNHMDHVLCNAAFIVAYEQMIANGKFKSTDIDDLWEHTYGQEEN